MDSPRRRQLLWAGLALFALFLTYRSFQDSRRTSVLVEWSTASELGTAGFNLFRSENPEGPFVKINESLIAPADDPFTGGDYTYQDDGVQPGLLYYYELEEVETGGSTARHGPLEVRAESGGLIIVALSLALFAVSFIGLVLQFRR